MPRKSLPESPGDKRLHFCGARTKEFGIQDSSPNFGISVPTASALMESVPLPRIGFRRQNSIDCFQTSNREDAEFVRELRMFSKRSIYKSSRLTESFLIVTDKV